MGDKGGMAGPVETLIRAVESEFELALPRPDRIAEACTRLRAQLETPPGATDTQLLCRLLPCLQRRSGPGLEPLFELLTEAVQQTPDPWCIVEGLLQARDSSMQQRALQLSVQSTIDGALHMDRCRAERLAAIYESEHSALRTPSALAMILALFARAKLDVESLFLEAGPGPLRRLAARLLDLDRDPVSEQLACCVLGDEAGHFLAPYLAYTGASRQELLALLPPPATTPPCLGPLRRAETECGPELLREIIAELGWPKVNLGLTITHYRTIPRESSVPFQILASEVPLLARYKRAMQGRDLYLAEGHGVEPERGVTQSGDDAITRFRALNLGHAQLLGEILDTGPLTRRRLERIVGLMDRIVADFALLFTPHLEECAILPDVWNDLKAKINSELEDESGGNLVSAELARRVQMFDDPDSLGAVSSIHGLKRYLHQQGLRTASRIIGRSRNANRSVSLLLAADDRVLTDVQTIRYLDLDPDTEVSVAHANVPAAVAAVSNAFGRQLLSGHTRFPGLDVHIYGNEVHYFLAYRNHPAFVRIDFSPPLKGGMIDLEYYGVSQYEIAHHPDPSLSALRRIFETLDFDVHIEGTHIQARYDKERALDLRDLTVHADALFRLTPYLMEIDWALGSLDLSPAARDAVRDAWADGFKRWGVLPLDFLIGKELAGEGRTDAETLPNRYHSNQTRAILDLIMEELTALGLELPPPPTCAHPGQLDLESALLVPLREAVRRGELQTTADGFARTPAELYETLHEAEVLAGILTGDIDAAAPAVQLAGLIAPLDRTLRFYTTGDINGYPVQKALLSLRDEELSLYVLRDAAGVIRLATYGSGSRLYRSRGRAEAPWQSSASTDVPSLENRLRRDVYLIPGAATSVAEPVAATFDLFRRPNPRPGHHRRAGERTATGLTAAPGRAMGVVRLGTERRSPHDLQDAILAAPSLQPDQNAFIYAASGVLSTGGGVLSHAGLIASQFGKPALIITGQWETDPSGALRLLYEAMEFEESATTVAGLPVHTRQHIRARLYPLREGDLVVLDADHATLVVLGQDRQALALNEGIQRFHAAARVTRGDGDREELTARGRRLQARYHLERLLTRLDDPGLARHAVYELLLGADDPRHTAGDESCLLSLLIGNGRVCDSAREALGELGTELTQLHAALCEKAQTRLPTTTAPLELLFYRREIEALLQLICRINECLQVADDRIVIAAAKEPSLINVEITSRLRSLYNELADQVRESAPTDVRRLHRIRQLQRLEGTGLLGNEIPAGFTEELDSTRTAHLDRVKDIPIITGGDGGIELAAAIGWKAANLAEIERLVGPGRVPPWFVVSDFAFRQMLGLTVPSSLRERLHLDADVTRLADAIDAILRHEELRLEQKSDRIRTLWDAVDIPAPLDRQILDAYRSLATPEDSGPSAPDRPALPMVAVRSSTCEEDVETAARAGEFETLLFVRGEREVLEAVRRAWSGLWTARAIHNRQVFGIPAAGVGGGLIVQRIASCRVSGVLLTANAVKGEYGEMVINAGLGMGEGVVSGLVPADHIVVSREPGVVPRDLRYQYITADKRRQVVFNRHTGLGTIVVDTSHHQRFQPALDYNELRSLVAIATELEAAYGFPLDIEFGIEYRTLWILQARPIPRFMAAWAPMPDARGAEVQGKGNHHVQYTGV